MSSVQDWDWDRREYYSPAPLWPQPGADHGFLLSSGGGSVHAGTVPTLSNPRLTSGADP